MNAIRDWESAAIRGEIARCEAEIAELAPRLAESTARVSSLRTDINNRNNLLTNLKQELDRRNRPSPEPRVSEHALLRYIERHLKIDVEAVRASILTDHVIAAIKTGAAGVTINGVKFVVHGSTIVTTLGDDQRYKRSTRKGRVVDLEGIGTEIDRYLEDRAMDSEGATV